MSYQFVFLVTAYGSMILSILGFFSGIYALWYDSHNRSRLKSCLTEYAAISLSTTLCLVYPFLINDWVTANKYQLIGLERNLTWMAYHSVDKLVVFFFHVVLVTRILRVRGTDERLGRGGRDGRLEGKSI
jgi:hypothetical protein